MEFLMAILTVHLATFGFLFLFIIGLGALIKLVVNFIKNLGK